MRTIQPPSKLMLLNNQRSRGRSPWPKLILALVLTAIVVFNIGVIRDRYSAEDGAGDASEPAEKEAPREKSDGSLAGVIAPSRALASPSPAASEPAEIDVPAEVVAEEAAPPSPSEAVQSGEALAGAAPAPGPVEPDHHLADEKQPSFAPAPLGASGKAAADGVDEESWVMVPGAPAGKGHALAHRVIAGTILPGQAVATAMMEAGLTGDQAHQVVSALQGIFDFRRARPGEGFRIKMGPEGELELFDYERSSIESYVVQRKKGGLVGYRRDLQVERELVRVEGEIRSSLFGAVEAAGADAALAVLLANVLAWDVDFYRDPRRGDRFRVVVERFHHRGRHLRYGDILAAEYEGGVGHVRLFRFERPDGQVGYYDEKGQSAQRAFLRAPLQVVRVTSGFGNRRHPILGYTRQHRGVDYGAPTGTPVWAVGDGTVTRAGRQGAYGNLIVLRHANGYTTWYAHLSRIHVRVGERVRQQQVIGRVGATGMATGPHLHYEIRHHGRHINPLTLKLPPREPLPESALPAYHAAIEPARALLDDVELIAQTPGVSPPP